MDSELKQSQEDTEMEAAVRLETKEGRKLKEKLVNQEWKTQSSILETFLKNKNLIASMPEWPLAFQISDRTVRCVDEGTNDGLHCAGSGILLDFEKAKQMILDSGADGITSHENCGAAKLAAQRDGIDLSKADEYGKQKAQELAQATNLPYKGHIAAEQMSRPAEFHNATVAYLDGTGQFNPARLKGTLPQGFVATMKYFKTDDIALCVAIAMGDHGFNQHFTKEHPFYIILIPDNNNPEMSEEKLLAETQPLLAQYEGRVACVTLPSPV